MGNFISHNRLIPQSILECLDDNQNIDMDLYFLYRRHCNQDQNDEEIQFIVDNCCWLATQEMEEEVSSCASPRRPQDNSHVIDIEPTNSIWYKVYLLNPR